MMKYMQLKATDNRSNANNNPQHSSTGAAPNNANKIDQVAVQLEMRLDRKREKRELPQKRRRDSIRVPRIHKQFQD